MNETEVIALMESCVTEKIWDAKCDEVKRRCGGYPDFWFSAIIQSGLAARIAARWGGDAQIHVHTGTERRAADRRREVADFVEDIQ